MAYSPKQGGEQETMYRFLTPGEAEQQEEPRQTTTRDGLISRKLHRLSVMYMSFFTPNQPHEDPPVCRFLASCLVVMGFTTGTALVALFFYMGFAYGIDEGFMLGIFALGSWVYGLVTYFCKTGCFRPLDESDRSSPSSTPSSSSLSAFPATAPDPPSYKEVTKNPPSYEEALRMIRAEGQWPVSTQCGIPKHQQGGVITV